MNHSIDQLFKKKLTDYRVNPTADAWEKLQFYKKNKRKAVMKIWWLGIAASILLICTATSIFLEKSESNKILYEIDIARKDHTIAIPEMPEPAITNPPAVTKAAPTPAVIKKSYTAIRDNNKEVIKQDDVAGIPIPAPLDKISVDVSEKLMEDVAIAKVPVPEIAADKSRKLTLFDRIIDTANDIKNSDGMMADLRHLKDEVVSLEFLKTKKSI